MKRIVEGNDCNSQGNRLQAPALRPLDPDIIRFVEALAIADARRDHLVAEHATGIDFRAAKALISQTEASTNGSRSHLRSILDRSAEREID